MSTVKLSTNDTLTHKEIVWVALSLTVMFLVNTICSVIDLLQNDNGLTAGWSIFAYSTWIAFVSNVVTLAGSIVLLCTKNQKLAFVLILCGLLPRLLFLLLAIVFDMITIL